MRAARACRRGAGARSIDRRTRRASSASGRAPNGRDLRRRCHVGNNEVIARGRSPGAAGRPSSPTTPRSPSCSSTSARSARAGTSSHPVAQPARGSTPSCAGARCSACWSTGAIARRTSRSACSAPGRRCPPARRRSPARPARRSCRSPSGGGRTAASSRLAEPIRSPRPSRPRPPARDPGHRRRDRAGRSRPRPSSGTASSRCGRRPGRGGRRRWSDAARADAPPDEPRPAPPRARRPRRRRPDSPSGGRDASRRGRLLPPPSWLACRLPEAPLVRLAELVGELWYRLTPARAAQARRNLRRRDRARGDRQGRPARSAPPRSIRGRSSGWSAPRFRHYGRATTSTSPGRRADAPPSRRPADDGDPGALARRSRPAGRPGSSSGSISARSSSQVIVAARPGRPPLTTPMETVDDPALQAYFVRTRGGPGIRIVAPARGPPRAPRRARARRRARSGSSAIAT